MVRKLLIVNWAADWIIALSIEMVRVFLGMSEQTANFDMIKVIFEMFPATRYTSKKNILRVLDMATRMITIFRGKLSRNKARTVGDGLVWDCRNN